MDVELTLEQVAMLVGSLVIVGATCVNSVLFVKGLMKCFWTREPYDYKKDHKLSVEAKKIMELLQDKKEWRYNGSSLENTRWKINIYQYGTTYIKSMELGLTEYEKRKFEKIYVKMVGNEKKVAMDRVRNEIRKNLDIQMEVS